MKKVIAITGFLVMTALLFTGCADTDVVKKYSQKSFDNIITAFPSFHAKADKDNYYTLTVDGQTRLDIGKNYSDTKGEDIILATPLKPFIDAGLDVSKLGAGYKTDEKNLYLITDFGSESKGAATVNQALFFSVNDNREALSYHEDLDHYGIALTGGKFEFAKDYQKNDKDIVFVINAKSLADIGVNVKSIEGWVFKTMKDSKGNDMDVLLKPYDLK